MLSLLRKFVSYVFGLEALIFLSVLPMSMYRLLHPLHQNLQVYATRALLGCVVAGLVGPIFLAAWWSLKRSTRYGRLLGIAGSCINILLSLPLMYYVPFRFLGLLWCLPVAGIVGLYLFISKPESTMATARTAKVQPIAGDGTHVLVNMLPWLVGTAGGIGGYIWCIRWCHDNGVARSYGLFRYAQVLVAFLLVTLIHEAGHAVAAWSVEMKIRAFLVGPFQFRKNDGKWTFSFDLAQTFSAGGATGAVHTNPHQPIWCDLFMIVAGPLINLATGTIAFCAVFILEPTSPLQTGGMLFLFGIYSFLACVTNLIPFRTGNQYSDGAKIYQLFSGGPFAELHGAFSIVSSSLESPMRPRDFDVDLIDRASKGAAQGIQIMLLRLFKYQYFLDCDRIPEAAHALTEAEAVYDQHASEVTAELHTSFIFGIAYVKRDAVRAREWWVRMEAKKPTRFNADYWAAHSALHWIEGRLDIANDSWHKGAAIAQRLPNAGAYDFDRYKYSLLRKELDSSAAKIYTFSIEREAPQPIWNAAG
jgi:hypothetical protein